MRAIGGVGLCRTCVMETRKPSKHSSLASIDVWGRALLSSLELGLPLRSFVGGPVSIADKKK